MLTMVLLTRISMDIRTDTSAQCVHTSGATHGRARPVTQPVRRGYPQFTSRKGTNGVSTNGVTADVMFFDRGTFWVLPFTYFYLPKSTRAYLCSQSVKHFYNCSGPISVDPICPQPSHNSAGLDADPGTSQLRYRRDTKQFRRLWATRTRDISLAI